VCEGKVIISNPISIAYFMAFNATCEHDHQVSINNNWLGNTTKN